jgi:hypothetical protein
MGNELPSTVENEEVDSPAKPHMLWEPPWLSKRRL